MPYFGEKIYSDKILSIHCSVRHNVGVKWLLRFDFKEILLICFGLFQTLPLFDINECLECAVKKGKLTLTIPWIVSYLSMIDYYSAHLQTYRKIWKLLIAIYKNVNEFNNKRNGFYLKIILGYIFQNPNFPPELFYNVLNDISKDALNSFVCKMEDVSKGLDSYDFVHENILYAVCPYLNEINVILSENLGCNVRHVKPVTTQERSFSKSQQISKQLEVRQR